MWKPWGKKSQQPPKERTVTPDELREQAENSLRLFILSVGAASGHLKNFSEAMTTLEKTTVKKPWFGKRWTQDLRNWRYARKLHKVKDVVVTA